MRERDAGRSATERGNKVRFHVADVFLPNAEEVRALFGSEEELEGIVMNFSDSGSRSKAFAIVEVVRRQTVVIPVERLQPMQDKTSQAEGG